MVFFLFWNHECIGIIDGVYPSNRHYQGLSVVCHVITGISHTIREVLKLEEVFKLDTPPQILTASTNNYSSTKLEPLLTP